MAFPFPKLADGSVLYGKGVPQLIFAGVPEGQSVAGGSYIIPANTVGSAILVIAEYSWGIGGGAPITGSAYLCIPSSGTAVRTNTKVFGDNNESEVFTLHYFTSGLTWSNACSVVMYGGGVSVTPTYLTILGF